MPDSVDVQQDEQGVKGRSATGRRDATGGGSGSGVANTPRDHGRTPARVTVNHGNNRLLYLALGALGVVYGDIGTSPLYAFRESFHESYGIPVIPENILGVLSLIFWALIIIISVKYLVFVLRADNHGEGGILALTALVNPGGNPERFTGRWLLVLCGLFGTALLYGDGVITPAISVLSAVEGLEVATPFFEPVYYPHHDWDFGGALSVPEPGHRRRGERSLGR